MSEEEKPKHPGVDVQLDEYATADGRFRTTAFERTYPNGKKFFVIRCERPNSRQPYYLSFDGDTASMLGNAIRTFFERRRTNVVLHAPSGNKRVAP